MKGGTDLGLVESVRRVDGLEPLLALLRDELAWPVEPAAAQEDYTFTWNADELRLDECATRRLCHGVVRQLRPFAASQPWGVFLVEFTDGHVYRSALRQVLRGLVPSRRRAADLPAWQHENLLFLCTTREYDCFTFAHFRGERLQKARLATFGWEAGDDYIRTLCEYNLPALRYPEDGGRDSAAWLSSWAKAFDKEPLTRVFFKRFEAALEAVQADLQNFHKLPSAQAYSRAQLLLERMIFCYFLQNRGWLAQDRNFLMGHFEPFRGRPNEFSYSEQFIEQLFWSLASAPRSDSFRFSDVPFLNGGLFDDDEFSPLRKKQNPPLKVRNSTFAQVFSDLLEAFNFTVCEDTPLNQDVAVDPEMLGKVFESIVLHAEAADPDAVAPDKRKATGSYYTPRIVVHFICRETLLQWLKTQLPGPDWGKRLKALFDIDPTDGLQADELARLKDILTPAQGTQVARLIADLKCCDPAVGSGAFPVGLLHELVNLRRVCEAAANGYVDPVRKQGTDWLHKTKADIVENALYGVDIQQQAIEICRLRLWLSLVVDYDLGVDPFEAEKAAFREALGRISQLPNLEMNFHRGDSLHDRVSDIPLLLEPGLTREHRKEMEAIRKLGVELHGAKKGERKRNLRIQILQKRLDLTEAVLKDELEKFQKFGGAGLILMLPGIGDEKSEAEKHRRLAEEIRHVQAALEKVMADRRDLEKLAPRIYDADFYARLRKLEGADFDSPLNFAWRLDLPAIFGHDPAGFDIIVGNPPFVTARNPKKRELYRARWPRVCHGKYLLVCPFFELSFGLLRPGGQLGFIVSNAFAKREFGKPLVEKFFPTVDLQKVVDCSGLMFPGHGTPTCIVFGRHQTPAPDSPIRVAAILPGGGDLRTPPEESPLWHSLEAHHDEPGFLSAQVIVADQQRREMHSHPWNFDAASGPTKQLLETSCARVLRHYLDDDIGVCTMTNCDDVFVLFADQARRLVGETADIRVFQEGDTQRNWSVKPDQFSVCPYGKDNEVLQPAELHVATLRYLKHYKGPLEERLSFGNKTFKELGRHWYEYERMNRTKYAHEVIVPWSFIATHVHAMPVPTNRLFKQSNVAATVATADAMVPSVVSAVLNSSVALFWLKQVCFSKRESEEGATDTYYEFAGNRVQRLPVPEHLFEVSSKDANQWAERLLHISEQCCDLGQVLPTLATASVLEKPAEAYGQWLCSLPGHVPPHAAVGKPFASADDLRAALSRVIEAREKLRTEMIARQEEMDWLVYQAYGLIDDAGPALPDEDLVLAREERPFCLWQAAEGDYAKAVARIPQGWSEAKKALWKKRLELIRDNEHIRRIEQPVYKRRWDEQWKVGNRWQCGQPAYDAEFLDAFSWWLSEKAEWHLEHVARGPMALDAWAAALWSDARIQAAWPVAAEAIHRLEVWKESRKEHPGAVPPAPDAGLRAFERFFRDLVKDQAVPENIPFAVPWDELEKKKVKVPAYVKRIRGKLNVPRERFWITADGAFRQAQPFGPPEEGAGGPFP